MKLDTTGRNVLFLVTTVLIFITWKLWNLQMVYNELVCENKVLNKVYKPEYKDIVNYLYKISDELYSVKYAFSHMESYDQLRTIYIVTKIDSYLMTQISNLVRLRNTLRLVPKLVWILVEDAKNPTVKMTKFIERSVFPETIYLTHQVSKNLTKKISNSTNVLYNHAFKWLIDNKKEVDKNGVVYFAEFTNSFRLTIFEDIRQTDKVSVWPVAYANKTFYQTPICLNNKVIDWYCEWNCTKEEYPIDISGFAINLSLILDKDHVINQNFLHEGISKFISSLVKIDDLEPRGEHCSKINVWKLDTCIPFLSYPPEKLKLRNMSYENFMLQQI